MKPMPPLSVQSAARMTVVGSAMAFVASLGACHPARSADHVASATERRDLLLRPDAAYWNEASPAEYRVSVETTKGTFVIAVTRALAPRGADRFYRLVRAGYFDDSRFFRVVPGFIAQFGIPGDPAITQVWKDRRMLDDSARARNVRGMIAYAMTGPNTRTTQLFISLVDNSRIDVQGFAPIGRVVSGMEVVDQLYGGYGETAGGGMRAGRQERMMSEGNRHLDRDFPKLDRLMKARVEH
jgi:cyclophilin family peptidyl-prolyl cis-trans isomerase